MDKKIEGLVVFLFLLMFLWGCSPTLHENQLQFGILAAQKELWDEAVFRWKKVIEKDPKSAAAHNNLAVAYEQMGLWQDAEREYLLALEIDPKNSYIQSNYQSFKERNEEKDETQ